MTESPVEALFFAALDQPTAEARAAFLAAACGDDVALRHRIEWLLAAHPPADFLAEPVAHAAPTATAAPTDGDTTPAGDPGPAAAAGEPIGPYRLLQKQGEGGMGEVWAAEQERPVKRLVALKLIKPGMDSARVVARFEQERQALALMDHAHIARVFDAGTTPAGRPYFVMELVQGVPITTYCDAFHLTIRERLGLFAQVCVAVQHAHQKGIIHRDLKPSNILVAVPDGAPVPKVIDFGIAKAVHAKLAERTLHTEVGAVVGTLEYMAPEQAELAALDVDTRADIYALGVLLYELLTGTTPLTRERLQRASFTEVLRLIREEEPPRPSTRLTESPESLTALAASRQTEPRKLARQVRGELDWIVLKCLEKDRNRRYETASGLARDIDRYLADEPVTACPPSAVYRVRKFVRRNRGPVLAASLVMLALVGGVIGTTAGMLRADQARQAEADRAEGERQAKFAAEQAAEAERQAKDIAQRRLAQIEKANDLLESIFRDLDPWAEETEGKPLRAVLGERMDQLLRDLDADAVGDPLVVARLQMTLARSLLGLGYAERATELLEKVRRTRETHLGPDHAETLAAVNNLALMFRVTGQPGKAVPLLEQVLARERSPSDPDHPPTLTAMSNLATAYHDTGQLDRAIRLTEQVLAARRARLGLDHSQTLTSMNNLATLYQDVGEWDKAVALHAQVLAARRVKHGPDHPQTLTSVNNLAVVYQQAGRLDKAVPLLEEALAGRRARLGPDHPDTLTSLHNRATAYCDARQLDKAIPLHEQVLAARRARLGPDHPHTLTSLHNLAGAYRAANQVDKAVPLLEEALAGRRARHGPDHPGTLTTMNDLAAAYWARKQLDRSIPLFEGVLDKRTAMLGPRHRETLRTMANLGVNYRDAGRLPEALPLLETAYREGRRHPQLAWVGTSLLAAYVQAGRADDAVAVAAEVIAAARRAEPAGSLPLAAYLAHCGALLVQAGVCAAAEPLLHEGLAIREKAWPNAWPTFHTKSLLGAALVGQHKYAEAEPLLVQGYEGLKRHQAKIPPQNTAQLTEAVERLVQLYDAWGKPDEAARWRAERAKLPLEPAPPPRPAKS